MHCLLYTRLSKSFEVLVSSQIWLQCTVFCSS